MYQGIGDASNVRNVLIRQSARRSERLQPIRRICFLRHCFQCWLQNRAEMAMSNESTGESNVPTQPR